MQTEWEIKVIAVEWCFQRILYLGRGGKKRGERPGSPWMEAKGGISCWKPESWAQAALL